MYFVFVCILYLYVFWMYSSLGISQNKASRTLDWVKYQLLTEPEHHLPFEIFMLDQDAGTAQLKARHPLNCKEKKNYVVTIAAVSRAGTE